MDWLPLVLSLVFLVVNPWSIWELRRTASARTERKNLAREELADFLESYLIRNEVITRSIIYQTANALAQKRRIDVDEIYRPISVLHELLARLRRNPAIQQTIRMKCESVVDSLMQEVKTTEGLELLQNIERTLIAAQSSISPRSKAKKLILDLIDHWTTFDDRSVTSQLRHPAQRLSMHDSRELALSLITELKENWSSRREGS